MSASKLFLDFLTVSRMVIESARDCFLFGCVENESEKLNESASERFIPCLLVSASEIVKLSDNPF